MIEIADDIYSALAQKLKKTIGTADYFNGTVEMEMGDVQFVFVATLVVYRRSRTTPEGVVRAIENVVPIWWELKTTTDHGEQINDFSFSGIKPLLTDPL